MQTTSGDEVVPLTGLFLHVFISFTYFFLFFPQGYSLSLNIVLCIFQLGNLKGLQFFHLYKVGCYFLIQVHIKTSNSYLI